MDTVGSSEHCEKTYNYLCLGRNLSFDYNTTPKVIGAVMKAIQDNFWNEHMLYGLIYFGISIEDSALEYICGMDPKFEKVKSFVQEYWEHNDYDKVWSPPSLFLKDGFGFKLISDDEFLVSKGDCWLNSVPFPKNIVTQSNTPIFYYATHYHCKLNRRNNNLFMYDLGSLQFERSFRHIKVEKRNMLMHVERGTNIWIQHYKKGEKVSEIEVTVSSEQYEDVRYNDVNPGLQMLYLHNNFDRSWMKNKYMSESHVNIELETDIDKTFEAYTPMCNRPLTKLIKKSEADSTYVYGFKNGAIPLSNSSTRKLEEWHKDEDIDESSSFRVFRSSAPTFLQLQFQQGCKSKYDNNQEREKVRSGMDMRKHETWIMRRISDSSRHLRKTTLLKDRKTIKCARNSIKNNVRRKITRILSDIEYIRGGKMLTTDYAYQYMKQLNCMKLRNMDKYKKKVKIQKALKRKSEGHKDTSKRTRA